MNNFNRIYMPDTVCGRGSLSFITTLGKKKVAVVGFMDSVEELVKDLFKETDTEVLYVGTISREPYISDLMELVPKVQTFAPDMIVGIGGGSVMDICKGLQIFYEYPEMTFEDTLKPFSLPELGIKCDLVLVPTTSGTGSEVSSAAVFINKETKVKGLILSNNMIPKYTILDSTFTDKLPASVQIATGLDAMCHAIEAMTAVNCCSYVRAIAMQSALDIVENLPIAVGKDSTEEEKIAAKEKLHIAASLAGVSITNAFTGICHSYDHPGPTFNIPHGICCGILLPNSIEITGAHPAYTDIAGRLGIKGTPEEKAMGLADYLRKLNDKLGVPNSFKEYGIDKDEYMSKVDFWAEISLNGLATKLSPAGMDMEKGRKFYISAYEGK